MEIEIINYIKEAKKHGLNGQEIKQNLLNVGWDAQAVEDSFGYVKVSDAKPKTENYPIGSNNAEAGIVAAPNLTGRNPQLAAAPSFVVASMPLSQSALPSQPGSDSGQQPDSQNSLGTANAGALTPAAAAPRNKLPKIIGALILALALLGIAGYFAYGYFYPSPAEIWNNYLKLPKNKISSSSFKLAYTDQGLPDSAGKPQNFSFSLNGTGYIDSSNASSTDLNSNFTVSYKLPGQSGSRDFKLIYTDNNLYLDLSSLTELNLLIGQQLSWIKINLDDAKKLASTTPASAQILDEQKQLQQKLANDLAKTLKGKQIITATKLLGSETVSGQPTYHLQNQFDKQALKDAANTILEDSFNSQPVASSSPVDITAAKQVYITAATQVLNNVFDKMQLPTFETWIGKKDSQLYKLSFEVKFPGAVSLANNLPGGLNPLTQNQAKSRDTKRVTDMGQLFSALELYFNDHNGYPAGLNGLPVGLSPAYIAAAPTAPSPSDGDCSDYYNSYWYTPTGTPKTNNGLIVYPAYQYTFCLGQDSAGYKAGIAKLTAGGIQGGIACIDKPENCHKQADIQQPAAAVTPPSLADLSFEITYSDFGKKQPITAPADSLDLIKYISNILGQAMGVPAPTGTLPSLGIDDSKLKNAASSTIGH